MRNLEIFDVNTESKLLNQHSLFNFLDRTKTGYGKRLLKRWFANPLRKIDEINDRLDAIEDLSNVSTLTDFFNSKIDKMPDFERALGRIYNSTNRQKLAFSTFDNFASNKLNEFIKLLEEFSKVEEIIETFQENHKKFKSRRLVKLTSFKIATKKGNFAENNSKNKKNPHNNQNINNLFPKITVLRKDIDEMIESSDGIIVPKPGTNEKFDEISKEIKGTQTKLNDILLQLKKKLKCSEFFYYHSKLKRYEIEIPDQFGPNMPSDYFLTSKKKGLLLD